MHDRQNALDKWLKQFADLSEYSLEPLAGDASFRRYLRLRSKNFCRIVMDAPPEKEPLLPFTSIANRLRTHGIRTPQVFASDETIGFALLEDFGDCLLLNAVSEDRADSLYKTALDTLISMQQCPTSEGGYLLPDFDAVYMLKELDLFRQWFLQGYLKITLTQDEDALIQQTFHQLSSDICSQPRVFIHRDYHSRNIMITNDSDDPRLGILDFQDAMQGPFTYDLASLLKDCYIQWPPESVMHWLTYFYEQSPVAKRCTKAEFIRAFDQCGLQRHLKVLGIFSRLYLRDNKPGYLKDLPLTLHYLLAALESYEELQPFYQFLQQRVHLP